MMAFPVLDRKEKRIQAREEDGRGARSRIAKERSSKRISIQKNVFSLPP
jgi:hypothetical protein